MSGYDRSSTPRWGRRFLSPAAELPSIIPEDFDDGELAKLAVALATDQSPL